MRFFFICAISNFINRKRTSSTLLRSRPLRVDDRWHCVFLVVVVSRKVRLGCGLRRRRWCGGLSLCSSPSASPPFAPHRRAYLELRMLRTIHVTPQKFSYKMLNKYYLLFLCQLYDIVGKKVILQKVSPCPFRYQRH